MKAGDLILVSVDDHVVEPRDMFERHLPASYRGRGDVPHVVRNDAGDDLWVYDDRSFPNIGLNAVAGRPRDEYGVDPTSFEEMRRGCWDVDARIGDMNANGVLGSMCFPSFPRLCGQVFAEAADQVTWRSCASRRTTTGTSSRGAALTPGASSPWASCRSGTSI